MAHSNQGNQGCGHLLVLTLLVGIVSFSSCAATVKIGVHGDELIFNFLTSLNSSETLRLFNVTQLNTTKFNLGPDPETVAQMRSYIESVGANPPDLIIGNYNGTVAIVAGELGIPYYCTSPAHANSDLKDTTYLQGSSLMLMNTYTESIVQASQKLISTIITRLNLILIADTISIDVNSLLNALTNQELNMVILGNSSNSSSAIREALFSISLRTDIEAAVIQTLFTSGGTLGMVLPEAASLSLMGNATVWIVSEIFPNGSVLQAYSRTGASIFSFALPTSNVSDADGLRLAMASDSIGHYLKSVSDGSTFHLADALSMQYSGILGAIKFENETRRNMHSALKVMLTSLKTDYIDEFGVWNKSNTDAITLSHGGLASKLPHLRALAFLREPYIMNASSDYYGFCVSVLNNIGDGLFTYDVLEVTDESKLLQLLQQGAGDLIVNPMRVQASSKATSNVTYCPWPLLYTGVSAMGLAADRKLDFINSVYPFSWNVWIAVILAFAILSITLYSIDKISPNDYKRSKFSVSESLFFVYSAFMMSKLRSTAVKPSSRLFILILWFASLMYCTTYGTNFFYMLIRSERNLPFDSLYSLYNQSDQFYRILVRNSSSMQSLAAQPATSYYRNLAVPDELVSSEAAALSLIKNSTQQDGRQPIFVGGQRIIKYFVARSCDLKMTSADELHQPLFQVVSSGLDQKLIDAISVRIQAMSDRGQLDQYQDTYWSAVKCSSNAKLINSTELHSVKIEQVAGIFIVLASVLVFSFFVLLLEHGFHQVTLHLQRRGIKLPGWTQVDGSPSDLAFEFMKTYRAEVKSVSSQGISVLVRGMRAEVPNQMLSPDPNKSMTAADLQIRNSDFVDVIFLGNDPKSGERLFKRIG